MIKSKTYIATPPGSTVKEQLNNRGMSQKEFAIRMDMSEKHISKFLSGEVILTSDMALRLEMVLGVPASFWNNLESIYRNKLQLVKEENEMDEDKEFINNFPYTEMSELGWVEITDDLTKRIFEMRRFFEVAKLTLLKEPKISKIVYKRQCENEKTDFSLMAWSQKVRIEARLKNVESINLMKLKELLPSLKTKSKTFDELALILSSCGIVLVTLPRIGDTPIHGAAFYDFNKIVIGLISNCNDHDLFWHSLFHEIGHILLGHLDNDANLNETEETQADEFARNFLKKINNNY